MGVADVAPAEAAAAELVDGVPPHQAVVDLSRAGTRPRRRSILGSEAHGRLTAARVANAPALRSSSRRTGGRGRTTCEGVTYLCRYIGPIYRTIVQMWKGRLLLELAVLGLLKEQQLHGYELKKRLTEALGPFSSVSFGSLYPALNRLETAGAVRAVDAAMANAAGPTRRRRRRAHPSP